MVYSRVVYIVGHVPLFMRWTLGEPETGIHALTGESFEYREVHPIEVRRLPHPTVTRFPVRTNGTPDVDGAYAEFDVDGVVMVSGKVYEDAA